LVGGEQEYIPKRPSCLLCHALNIRKFWFGAHASIWKPNHLDRHRMTQDVDGS
jgi:hypothetical protein